MARKTKEIENQPRLKNDFNQDIILTCNIIIHVHTEKYLPKSYVINYHMQMSSSQSEE